MAIDILRVVFIVVGGWTFFSGMIGSFKGQSDSVTTGSFFIVSALMLVGLAVTYQRR